MANIRDRLWEKAGRENIPLTGAFELLPVCNLSCKMCYVRKNMEEVNASGGLLSPLQWLELAKEAQALGLLFPLLTGGEPFLYQGFQEVLCGMQEMGLQVSINSNGTMIDEKMAGWLARHMPTRINITLYGASETSYKKLCGNGAAYGQLRKAVEYLKRFSVPIKFNASITPDNIDDLENMIAYAQSVGSPIQIASYMFPPVRRDPAHLEESYRLTPEEAGFVKAKADFLQSDQERFRLQAKRYQNFIPISEEMLLQQSLKPGHKMTCRAGHCSFWIDWQGNLLNCGMWGSARQSLKHQSFDEAWEKLVKETDGLVYSPVCTNCPNWQLCHACIAMVHSECGNLNGRPEYLCRMNQAAARYYLEFLEQLP